jgi:mono/diheme cytochrome c family protein
MKGGIMRAYILIITVLVLILVRSWAVAEMRPPNPKNGETIYQEHCLRCHGQAGDGLGADARDLIEPPVNFQALKSRSKSDTELMRSISHGELLSPMHGWRDRLSEQEMVDVLSYIRTLAPFLPVT